MKINDEIKSLKAKIMDAVSALEKEHPDLSKEKKSITGQFIINKDRIDNAQSYQDLRNVLLEILNKDVIANQPKAILFKNNILRNFDQKYLQTKPRSTYNFNGLQNLLIYVYNTILPGIKEILRSPDAKNFKARDSFIFDESQFITDGKYKYAVDYLKEITKRINPLTGGNHTFGEEYIKEDPKHSNKSVLKMYAYIPSELYEDKNRKATIKQAMEEKLSGLDVKLENNISKNNSGNSVRDFQVGVEEDGYSLVDFIISLPESMDFSENSDDEWKSLTKFYVDSKKKMNNVKDTLALLKSFKDSVKVEDASFGEEVAQKVAKLFNEADLKVGPFAEEPVKAKGNMIHLWSQAGDEWITFGDDGSVVLEWKFEEGAGEDGSEEDVGEMKFKSIKEFDEFVKGNVWSWWDEIDLSEFNSNEVIDACKEGKDMKKDCDCAKAKDKESPKEIIARIAALLSAAHDNVMEAKDLCDDLENNYNMDVSELSYGLEDLESDTSDFDTAGDVDDLISKFNIEEVEELDMDEEDDDYEYDDDEPVDARTELQKVFSEHGHPLSEEDLSDFMDMWNPESVSAEEFYQETADFNNWED